MSSSLTDASFWSRFLHNSHLTVNDETISQYGTALSDRFTSLGDLSAMDENALIRLGITNVEDQSCLINQARLVATMLQPHDDQSTLKRSSNSSTTETWPTDQQSTPLNPNAMCYLSPVLLSRISFNECQ